DELDLHAFQYLLESGALIEHTQRFRTVTVMDRDAVKLADLLETHQDFDALSRHAPRKVQKRLVELLFGFHSRGQITLGH
ncbi:MAG: hypothetical protein AAFQ82_19455, partial [Myxococcota bacterium]